MGVREGRPVLTSHNRTVISAPTLASCCPSGLNAVSITLRCARPACRRVGRCGRPPVHSPAGAVGSCQSAPVRTERNPADVAGRVLEAGDWLAGRGIPHAQRPLAGCGRARCGRQLTAIRAEDDAASRAARVDDLGGGLPLDDRVKNPTVGGIADQSMRGDQLLKRGDVAATKALGEYVARFGQQAGADRLPSAGLRESRSMLARTKPTTAVAATIARTRTTLATCTTRRSRRRRSARMLASRKSRPVY